MFRFIKLLNYYPYCLVLLKISVCFVCIVISIFLTQMNLLQDQLQRAMGDRAIINTAVSGKVRSRLFIHILRASCFPRFSPRPTLGSRLCVFLYSSVISRYGYIRTRGFRIAIPLRSSHFHHGVRPGRVCCWYTMRPSDC